MKTKRRKFNTRPIKINRINDTTLYAGFFSIVLSIGIINYLLYIGFSDFLSSVISVFIFLISFFFSSLFIQDLIMYLQIKKIKKKRTRTYNYY